MINGEELDVFFFSDKPYAPVILTIYFSGLWSPKSACFFLSEGLNMFKLEFVVTAGFFLINDVRDR
jgi:hypothetical protein